MILTRNEIKKRIGSKSIKIEPFDDALLGPASIDIRLGREFRRFRARPTIVDLTEEVDFDQISTVEEADEFILHPGEFALGISKENITLSQDIAGFLRGRSRFARLGLIVNSTADFIQPGIDNRQVLEIRNLGVMPIKLKEGMPICQLILMECRGEAKYKGIFSIQRFLK